MRICHVITRLILGGAQENTVSTVLGLARLGHDVELVSGHPSPGEGDLLNSFAQSPSLLTLSAHLVRPIHPWHDALATRDLIRHFKATRPGLVHTHSGKAGILARLAARRCHVKLIVHGIHGPSFGPFQGPLANFIFRSAERIADHWTDQYVVVAQAMTDQYLAANIGRSEQYTRIFSGFDLSPYMDIPLQANLCRNGSPFDPADFVVAAVARIAPLKGHEDLLQLASICRQKIPRFRMLFVGDGPLRPQIAERVHCLNLERVVVFAGMVSPDKVPGLLSQADVTAHLSLREGLPRALSQSLAAGRPVVAYDCDGASEVCLHERTGFLTQPGDVHTMARHLESLATNPALRLTLGKAGRALVRADFSQEIMVERTHQLYLRLGVPNPRQPMALLHR